VSRVSVRFALFARICDVEGTLYSPPSPLRRLSPRPFDSARSARLSNHAIPPAFFFFSWRSVVQSYIPADGRCLPTPSLFIPPFFLSKTADISFIFAPDGKTLFSVAHFDLSSLRRLPSLAPAKILPRRAPPGTSFAFSGTASLLGDLAWLRVQAPEPGATFPPWFFITILGDFLWLFPT